MTLQTEVADGVLTLCLNRPERLNAIDESMARALLDALGGAERSPDVRVIVLRGNGRAFCAGRDVSEAPTPEILALVQDVSRAIVVSTKPVLAMVHGWVVGAGVEWMLAADIVVAARSARFKLPEIGLGVFVTGGITRTLPGYAGLARAKGLLLLGEEFSAEDAGRWGLVWSVVDDERLDGEVARIVARLAGFDPRVVGRFKRVLNELNLDRFEASLDLETRMQTELAADMTRRPRSPGEPGYHGNGPAKGIPMNAPIRELPRAARPADIAEEEWALRLELAACYRLFVHLGWTEMIFNHITLRVPGDEPHFLINPYGLHYSEVTARNLVKIDIRGNVIGASAYPINPAGFVIHAAIHANRPDAHCVIHTHTTAGIAVACKADGLRYDNFYSAQFWGRVAYHDFEGVTTDLAEQERLVASLGKADALILRNHGLLVVGPSIPEAFIASWSLQRACEVQVAAGSMPGPNRPIPEAVLRAIPAQQKPMQAGHSRPFQPVFDAMLRVAGIRPEDIAGH